MSDCPNGDVRDLLPDYLHDRLTLADRRAVDVHLAACAACRDELALLRDLRGTMRRAPAVDVDAIAAAIQRLLDDPELVERVGAAARERAATFTWARTADAMVDAYRDAIG
jgi:anti-sigma factor RsiW